MGGAEEVEPDEWAETGSGAEAASLAEGDVAGWVWGGGGVVWEGLNQPELQDQSCLSQGLDCRIQTTNKHTKYYVHSINKVSSSQS